MGRAAMTFTALLLAAACTGQPPARADDDSDKPAARKLIWAWSLLQSGLTLEDPIAMEEMPRTSSSPLLLLDRAEQPPGSQNQPGRNVGAGGPAGPTGAQIHRYWNPPERIPASAAPGFEPPDKLPVVQPLKPSTPTPPAVSPPQGATPGPAAPPQAESPLPESPTGDLPQGAAESPPALPKQDAPPEADPPVNQSPQQPKPPTYVQRQTPTRRQSVQATGDQPGPTIGSTGLPEQAPSSSATSPGPATLRSFGNLVPSDRRTYPAPYGFQPGPTVPYPRRSMGNLQPAGPATYQGTPGPQQPVPGFTPPYPGMHPQRSMGNMGAGRPATPRFTFPYSGSSGRRSIGNLGPRNRATPAATAPIQARQRRSMGNSRGAGPAQ